MAHSYSQVPDSRVLAYRRIMEATTHQEENMGPRGGGYGGFHLIMSLFAGFIGLLLTAAVVYLIVRLVQKKGGPRPFVDDLRQHAHHATAPQMPDALRILDERLARGDIDVDDYTTRRNALVSGGYGNFRPEPAAPQDPPRPPAA